MARKEPTLAFKSKADERTAQEDFANLRNHPGWQRIVAYCDGKIAYYEKIILGDSADTAGKPIIATPEDLQRWRDKRNIVMQLRNLPDILSTVEELNDEEPDLDPFE